jgi:hypothetical protein
LPASNKQEHLYFREGIDMTGDTAKQRIEEIRARLAADNYPSSRIESYCRLLSRIEQHLLPHKVIRENQYSRWFSNGDFDISDLRHFLTQFSVFSNFFVVAQLLKTINAPTLEAMHASKEILMNELGVAFHSKKDQTTTTRPAANNNDFTESEGTVDGSVFRFSAAHFEWLLHMTTRLGLQFKDIGKRKHATQSTLHFCDELARIYGAEDSSTAMGASFAVENWAAAGFWKELIQGVKLFKVREIPDLPIGFFIWHDMVEDQHARHTWEELEEAFFSHDELDENKFIRGGVDMLDGVQAFWNGLNADRMSRDDTRTIAS